MNAILFYDTETTGLPLFEKPSEHPDQPHIVQLAALLYDIKAGREIASIDVIVKPDGWSIPAEVSKIHGITDELASDVGVSESMALGMLLELWGGRLRVAHNQSFDARIVRIAQMRFDESKAERWQQGPAQCTATMATPIMKLPPTERMRAAGRNHPKTPNLGEAHKHFTGLELEGAHNAMVDVRACLSVYLAITRGDTSASRAPTASVA